MGKGERRREGEGRKMREEGMQENRPKI